MKKLNIRKIVFILLAIYAAIFIARAVYNFIMLDDMENYDRRYGIQFGYMGYSDYNYDYSGMSYRLLSSNIASFRQVYETAGGMEIIDQKYEKIASVTAKTTQYKEDEKKAYDAIEEYLAVIQMERKTGLEGSRRLSLVIGVKPDHFDGAVEKINEIGKITSYTTTKTDKTYEYRQMTAEKEKLIRQRESYEAMKDKGGSISEMLTIEDRIIKIEAELQEQSVRLDTYSDDNALCTIEFTMSEGNTVSIWLKLWNAFVWSTVTYLQILGIFLLTCAAAFISLTVWKYGKKIYIKAKERIENKEDE